jgi:hypothetical protein
MADKEQVRRGVGVDLGTMNIVSARKTSDGIKVSRVRDVFVSLDPEAKRMLKMSNTPFIVRDGGEELIVVGDTALEIASTYGKEARRPLSAGLISSSEIDSLEILGILIRSVLGDPKVENEVCYYSIPAEPVDNERDVVYHKKAFARILVECGYQPFPSNEAMGVIYSETGAEGFSGIALSFGSGMTNVALAVRALPAFQFSLARGGDWIDKGAAHSIGSTPARLCSIKEKGVDLLNPKVGEHGTAREREALSFYYQEHIDYALRIIAERFRSQCNVELADPIPLIVSGGTSLANGFMKLFEQVFERHKRKFPIKISTIRQAKDPLNAVAHGLLIQALQEYD